MNWQPKPTKPRGSDSLPSSEAAKPEPLPLRTAEALEAERYWSLASVFLALEVPDDTGEVAWCQHMAVFYETLHQLKAREITQQEAEAALSHLAANRPSSPFALNIAKDHDGIAPEPALTAGQKAAIRAQVLGK